MGHPQLHSYIDFRKFGGDVRMKKKITGLLKRLVIYIIKMMLTDVTIIEHQVNINIIFIVINHKD